MEHEDIASEILECLDQADELVKQPFSLWTEFPERIIQAQSLADHAALLYGRLIRMRERLKLRTFDDNADYQVKYDQTVHTMSPRFNARSWEERGSEYRVALLSDEIEKRKRDKAKMELDGIIAECDIYRWQIISVRTHLAELLKVLQLGDR